MLQSLHARFLNDQHIAHYGAEVSRLSSEIFADSTQHSPRVIMPYCSRRAFPSPAMLLDQPSLSIFEAKAQIIQLLLALIDAVYHPPESAMLRSFSQCLLRHQQAVASGLG